MKNTFKPKRINWATFFSGLFTLCQFAGIAQTPQQTNADFINELVQFYEERCGEQLNGSLFSETAVDTPYIFVYVSKRERVENALQSGAYHIFCKNNLDRAKRQDTTYRDRYDTFIFSTQANVNTKLTEELTSYRRETQAFIVFHELTHIYLSQLQSKLTFTVSESLGDLVGNYLTREFAMATKKIDLKVVDAQILLNEQVYTLINNTIVKMDKDPKQRMNAHAFCEKELKRLLVKGDGFQKKRYLHPVNNASLYCHSFYSENYFDLKTRLITNRQLPKNFRTISKG